MRCKNSLIFELIGVFTIALLWIGCQGPQGPAGRDGILPDTQAPIVDWVYPFGDTVLTNIDTLLINITDNSTIDTITFIANGRTVVNGLNRLSTVGSVYRARWDTRFVNSGQYTLMARAFDHAGNVGLSSPINVIVYNILTGQNPLQNCSDSADVSGWKLPDVDQTSIYAVQLTPLQACSLAAVRYEWLPNHPTHTRTDTLIYYLIAPDTLTGYPGVVLDSMVIPPDTVPRRFNTVNVHGYRWVAGQTLYIGIGSNPNTQDTIQIATDVTPYTVHDWYYVPHTGWSRIPASGSDPHNLMIGAVVYYNYDPTGVTRAYHELKKTNRR